jgi:Zn-dependent protease
MMTDPLMWSPINLGRWFGVQVRVHGSLLVFVGYWLFSAAITRHDPKATSPHYPEWPIAHAAAWLLLLLAALAVHEFGHAIVASWFGTEPEDVRLWPLGSMVGPPITSRSADNILVALGGPAANAIVVLITALGVTVSKAHFAWSPFGDVTYSGAPFVHRGTSLTAEPDFTALWFVGWFGYLNYVLLLANLIPALPFDMGRVLRIHLANAAVTQPKDSQMGPYAARACASILAIIGVIRLIVYQRSDGLILISLAALVELIVRSEARMLEDGGFYDDGVFGYDFSEGYTSLEGSAAKVRPYRESALRRWRRRRSDLRRQRRQAREAAEERRMDEILEKLHREGRHALTDEEHRFLVRVSAKYRNRPKARD